jgi:hypothetical protein
LRNNTWWGKNKNQLVLYCRAKRRRKDSSALRYLPQTAGCSSVVNADLIAYGISPFDSYQLNMKLAIFFSVRYMQTSTSG